MNTETEAVTPESEPTHRRGIKSFVLRQGHMTAAQQKAIDEQWARVGVDYRPQVVDLDAVFQSTKPKVLEIGFGMGTATAEIARALPDMDFLAIDVHGPGVGNLCKLIAEQNIGNIRVMRHDAVEVVENMLAESSLHYFLRNTKSHTPCPKRLPRASNLVSGRYAGVGAKSAAVFCSSSGNWFNTSSICSAYSSQSVAKWI